MYLDSEPTIRSIVEAMLPRFSDNFLGLLMEVDMTYSGSKPLASDPERTRRYEKRKFVYLLFVRPTNYTQVYVIVSDKGHFTADLTEWKLTCDHDSCWSSDGLRPLQEAHYECMRFFEKKGIEWKDIHHYCSFGLGGVKYVLFPGRKPIGTPEPNRSISYHRDWEIHVENLNRALLYSRKGDNQFSSEGLLVDRDFLKSKGIDPENIYP